MMQLFAVLGFGQATGAIHGTIRDPSGAVQVGRRVAVTNIETNQVRVVDSGETGQYTALLLPSGTYTVRVEAPGFKTFLQQNIVVAVNTDVEANVDLELAEASAEITVRSESTLVQTATSNLVHVVEKQRIVDLPLNGRNVLQLTTLAPGVVSSGAAGGTIQGATVGQGFYNVVVSVNGSRGNGNNYLLDNVDNNDNYTNINAPMPNPDAVMEFSLQASSFDAQYGRALGGVVNVVTKSGTNQPHGSLFEFLRNYKLNAANFFSGRDSLKRNQFGGSFGAPVWIPKLYSGKDRTFFFTSYQGTRQRTASSALAIAASPAMQSGDFSAWLQPNGNGAIRDPLANGQYFPRNQIPTSRFDPVSKNILKYMPPSSASNYQLRYATPPTQLNDDQVTVRLDHSISAAQRLSFRYLGLHYDNPWVVLPNNTYSFNIGSDDVYHSAVVNHTAVISPRWLNEFNAGVHFSKALLIPPASLSACCSLAGFGSRVNDVPENETLTLGISGWTGQPEAFHRDQRQYTYLLSDNVSFSTGRHQFRFGTDFQRYRIDYTTYFLAGAQATFSGQLTADPGRATAGNAYADFLLGVMASFRNQSISRYRLYNNFWSAYFQDDFKVNSKLTLNLGVRLDPRFWANDKYGQTTTFIPGRQSTAFPNAPRGLVFNGDPGVGNPVVGSSWLDVAPRIGFAYQVFPKTVIRAAYGIFFDQYMLISNNRAMQAPPWVDQISLANSGYLANPYGSGEPIDVNHRSPTKNATFLPYSVFALPVEGITPGYSQNWNFILERQLASDLLVRAAYIGAKGTHLLVAGEQNAAVYGPGATTGNLNQRRPYAQIGSLVLGSGSAWSKYQSGQFTLEKRFTRGFSVLTSYTFAKSSDISSYGTVELNNVGPNPYNWNANRGLSDFDIAHRFVASGVWTLPAFKDANWLVHGVLGGWQSNAIFSAQSGLPLTVFSGVDNALAGIGVNFADHTGADWRISGDRSKSEEIRRWFNTAAFKTNALGTFGTGGRGQLRAPGAWNLDYSLFKHFQVTEAVKLQFRGEFFNVFNHANLGGPNTSVISATFGQITSAGSPRIVQLSLKVVF